MVDKPGCEDTLHNHSVEVALALFGIVSSLPIGSISRQSTWPAPPGNASLVLRGTDNAPVCFTLAHSTSVPLDIKDHALPQSLGSTAGLLTTLVLIYAQCGRIFRVLTFRPLTLAQGPLPTLGISSPTAS